MSSFAAELPTLPFFVLKTLFDQTPLTTDDGVVLRRMTLDIGVIHLVLACLSVLGHHAPRQPIPGFHQEVSHVLVLLCHHCKSVASDNSFWVLRSVAFFRAVSISCLNIITQCLKKDLLLFIAHIFANFYRFSKFFH